MADTTRYDREIGNTTDAEEMLSHICNICAHSMIFTSQKEENSDAGALCGRTLASFARFTNRSGPIVLIRPIGTRMRYSAATAAPLLLKSATDWPA
ncbi:MAG: hypothetical protein WAS54_08945 [Scrofimicrobium sp.]